MSPAFRALLLLSTALWLSAAPARAEPPERPERRARHLDMHGIMDPAGVMGHIGDTLNQAGRVLGMRIADSVADLVSSAFGHAPSRTAAASHLRPAWTRGDPGAAPLSGPSAYPPPYAMHRPQPLQQPSVLGGVLKLLGLDSSKLGAIALNGVIFLAQLISNSLVGRPPSATHARSHSDTKAGADAASGQEGFAEDEDDEEPEGSPLSWILDNPALKASSTLRQAQSDDLSERLIEEIQDRFPRPGSRRARALGSGAPADTSCIQLLVCRAGPFLRGMQRSLRPVLLGAPAASSAPPKGDAGQAGAPSGGGQSGAGQQRPEEVVEAERWRGLTPVQRMFAHMPTTEEVLGEADTCSQRFPNCKVSY